MNNAALPMPTVHLFYYFLPLIPLATRLLLCVRWYTVMHEVPPEEAQERDVNRSFILSLAGFSFTAVAGFSVLDATTRLGIQLPTWYVLVSFVAYIATLNVQAYKSNRFQNQIATALVEIGTFSLMLALAALLFSANFSYRFRIAAIIVVFTPWLFDHMLRLYFDYRFLGARHAKLP